MIRAALTVLCIAFALAACGGDDEQSGEGLKLGDSVTLTKDGVDSKLTASTLTDPYVPEGPQPPAGKHYVGVALSWVDEGKPFPHDFARFSLVDDKGARTSGAVLSPLKRAFADKPPKGQPQTQIVALPIDDASKPRALELNSIVKSWPFEASWSLTP